MSRKGTDAEDVPWDELSGGYRVPYDPRPALTKLRALPDDSAAWSELWQELHHQGDVGEASYASVPELVRMRRETGVRGWRTYALVGTIDLARTTGRNPPIPSWLEPAYSEAMAELASIGLTEMPHAHDAETVRSILTIIALWKGLRTQASLLLEYTDDELEEILSRQT